MFFWFSSISTPTDFSFSRIIIYNKLMHNLEYKSRLWDDVMWSLDNISHILSIWPACILDINPTELNFAARIKNQQYQDTQDKSPTTNSPHPQHAGYKMFLFKQLSSAFFFLSILGYRRCQNKSIANYSAHPTASVLQCFSSLILRFKLSFALTFYITWCVLLLFSILSPCALWLPLI